MDIDQVNIKSTIYRDRRRGGEEFIYGDKAFRGNVCVLYIFASLCEYNMMCGVGRWCFEGGIVGRDGMKILFIYVYKEEDKLKTTTTI